MSLPTYLQLVNKVLLLLRADQVTSVSANKQSLLVGQFVNEAKRAVEDSFNWDALTASNTFDTVDTVYAYVFAGAGSRYKVVDAYNVTSKTVMYPESTKNMNRLFLYGNTQTGSPLKYNFNGMDSNGDPYVNVFPKPNNVFTLQFNLWVPQAELSNDLDTMLVPSEPVVQLAYAKALVERGEDGGTNSSEAYALFERILSDAISIESNRYPDNESWVAT